MLAASGCYNRHVNGTRLPASRECIGDVIASVDNPTPRMYDMVVGGKYVGTVNPGERFSIRLEPRYANGPVSLREAPGIGEKRGTRLSSRAVRLLCTEYG